MAIKDLFACIDAVEVTAASTTEGDLQGFSSAAFLVICGTTPSALDLEESDDGSSYANIADEDLLYTDENGDQQQGLPGGLGNDERVVVRYRGTSRYLRGGGTNLTVELLRGTPGEDPVPQPVT